METDFDVEEKICYGNEELQLEEQLEKNSSC